MTIEARQILDREEWLKWREEDIGASVGGCLFGADVHPYTTAYQLWALKCEMVKPKPIDPKLARRGEYVEMIAPDLIKEERPDWTVIRNPFYYRDPELRIGATPDLVARRPDIEGTGLIDVKSVGAQTFRKWRDRDTGNTELPVHYAIQVNIQVALATQHDASHWALPITWGAVAAITIGDAGLDIEILDVPLLPGLFANFRELARDFWRRVEAREPYPIDWGRDAGTILDMYQDDDGGLVDLSDDDEFANLVALRVGYKQIEKEGTEAEAARRLIDARIIHRMGNAEKARAGGALIKAPTVRVKEAVRKAYSFRRISVAGYEAREAGSSPSDHLEG